MKWTLEHDDVGFLRWLREVDPDLICLMAPNTGLVRNDPWLAATYPNRVEPQRGAWWPIILLSRPSAEQRRLAPLSDALRHSFVARRSLIVDVGARRPLLFTGMRPPSPRTIEYWRDSLTSAVRDGRVLRAFADSADVHVLVAGDFNSTPFGRVHRTFSDASGLRPWAPLPPEGTWPAEAPSWLALAIDRVWVDERIRVRRGETGPAFGSDHRPIVLDLEIVGDRASSDEGAAPTTQH